MLIVLTLGWCRACQCHTLCLWLQWISICKQKSGDFKANKHKNNLNFYNWNEWVLKHDRMVSDPTCSDMQKGEKTQANWNFNQEVSHLPMSGILIVKPGRKKSLNWKVFKSSSFKRMLHSSSSSTWNCPRGIRQFSHLFIGCKGPRDNKTQNTHVLNSQASLGTSGNKMADKHRGLPLAFRSFDLFYSGVVQNQDEG